VAIGPKKESLREKDKSPFSGNLRLILDERKLTGKAAAEICGVAPSVVADWLAGGMPTNPLALQRLAVALKVSFEWLLTGTTTSAEGRELTVAELFEEQDVGLSGIFKIEAKRLVKRS
jgi:transcriptional regulator with XRE-family HTH domain